MKKTHNSDMMKINSNSISSKLILALALLLVPCMTALAGTRNYVFVDNGPQLETAKYYYRSYEKGEQTRNHTDKYAKVTAAPSDGDWSGTYLFVGQTDNRNYWAFTGNSISPTATSGAIIGINTYCNNISDNNANTLITSPEGVVEVKVELVGNAKDSKGLNYYSISFVKDNIRYYIGNNTNNSASPITGTTQPSNLNNDEHNKYLWQINAIAKTNSVLGISNGGVQIINRYNPSAYLHFRYYNSYKTFSITTTANITANSSSSGWSVIHLYEKLPDYTVSYDANGGTGTMTDSGNPYTSGNIVTVFENEFSAPTGKAFLKWNTDSEGNGIDYAPGATFAISGNTTLFAQWTDIHNIIIASTVNGSVTTSPVGSANAGIPIDITITPDAGYMLESLVVTDSENNQIEVVNRRFTMPDDDVTITATFRLPTGNFIKRTDLDDDSWAGTYKLGFYEGGGGDYAFAGTAVGTTSHNSTGVAVTYSDNHDIIFGGKTVIVEYGGKWPSNSTGSTAYIDSSYYFMYFEDGVNKQYINGGTGYLSFNTLTTLPTTNTYKWHFFVDASGKFAIKNFYGNLYFLRATNAGSNHHVNLAQGSTQTTGPDQRIYMYKYDIPTYNLNVIGNEEACNINVTRTHAVIPDRIGYAVYADSTVSITIMPYLGYEVTSVTCTTASGTTTTLSSGITSLISETFTFDMPAEAATITINTLAEGESGSKCVSEGEYNASNHNTASQTTSPNYAYNKMPYVMTANNSYKQIVYSDENLPNIIGSIGFMYWNENGTNITEATNVEIYLGDTTASTLSDWVSVNKLIKVYDGPMNFYYNPDNGHWKDFVFNENGGIFNHDTSKNLIVVIHNYSNRSFTGTDKRGFYWASAGSGNNVQLLNYGSNPYGFDENGMPVIASTGAAIGKSSTIYYPLTHFCEAVTYTVTCATGLSNGSISASPNSNLLGGETITITAVPETGYTLSTVTATNATTSEAITLSGSGNTRTFIMPEADVTVTATFASSVAANTWTQAVTTQPAGYTTSNDSIYISSKEGLAWLISVVNGLNEKTADNLSGKTVNLTADMDMSQYIWVPIGYSSSAAFAGTFNGNYHTIKGIHISDATEISDVETATGDDMLYTSLFGYTNGATIKNTFVLSGQLANNRASGYLGGLVGYANNSAIEMCETADTLKALANLAAVGGMIGGAANGTTAKGVMVMGNIDLGTEVANAGAVIGVGAAPETFFTNHTITGDATTKNVAGTNGYIRVSNANFDATAAYKPGNGEGQYSAPVAYQYGDYTTNNAVNGKPLYETLNENLNNGFQWIRPKGSLKINGGYPFIARKNNDAILAVANKGNEKPVYYGEANSIMGNAQLGGQNTTDIYIYSNGIITTTPSEASLFIDEHASIKQPEGAKEELTIAATVGITMDNSANNGEKDRDWHTFASSLTAGQIGIGYNGSQPTIDVNNVPVELAFPTDYWIVQNSAVYFPSGIPTTNNGTEFDIYSFYEPQYHWINLKRAGNNHWHEDGGAHIDYNGGGSANTNETIYTPGKGYLIAIGDNSNAKKVYMSATGTLQNGDENEEVKVTVTNSGDHLTGYNLLGNPYQSYLDFQEFAKVNENIIWGNDHSKGYLAYLIYDADRDGLDEYLFTYTDGGEQHVGQSFSQGSLQTASRYIHPHQGFFVVKKTADDASHKEVVFNNDMRSITETSSFRDEVKPAYPLVNLVCTDDNGKGEISVIEFERPSMAGSLRMKNMLGAKGNMYIRWEGEDFGNVFLTGTPEYVPVWFKAVEAGVFTMTWSTANGDFSTLRLIDNLTGANIDMLTTDSYSFEAKPSDSKARFRLVFSALGIEEETTEYNGNFAFFNGNELVVNGEGELSLIDLNGRVLNMQHLSGQQSHIAMPKVASGMYMLRLANSEGVRVQKIVIRK